MAGTAGSAICPSATARRYNRRPIASRSTDGSKDLTGGSSTRPFYTMVPAIRQRLHASCDGSLQRPQRCDEVVLGKQGHTAHLVSERLRRGGPVVGEGDVGAVPVRSEVVAPEPATG